MTAPLLDSPVRVLVVAQCPAERHRLRRSVATGSGLVVVGEARTPDAALELVLRLRPAVVLLALEAASDDEAAVPAGLAAIERIMSACPTPVLAAAEPGPHAAAAMAAGAVGTVSPREDDAASLQRTVRLSARIRVITHPRARLRTATPPPPVRAVRGAVPTVRVIGVGASTGGPNALLTLLRELPRELPQAVLVVQHMTEGFLADLAAWLDRLVPLSVGVGVAGGRLLPGTVTFAPSGGNFVLVDEQLRVAVEPPTAQQFHVPGIDATFESLARVLGPAAVGVLLTGMGRDGAVGLRAMRDRGARTLAQDEATSTVYGMPAAAAALGGVDRQLPLGSLAAAVQEACSRPVRTTT